MVLQKAGHLEEIPAVPGAYGLLIRLVKPLILQRAWFRGQTLDIGTHLYAGGANGPGGLKTHVARHLRREKKLHRHVDEVTADAQTDSTFVVPGGSECEIVRLLAEARSLDYSAPGFRSSDCGTCASHLMRLEKASSRPTLAQWIGATEIWSRK